MEEGQGVFLIIRFSFPEKEAATDHPHPLPNTQDVPGESITQYLR